MHMLNMMERTRTLYITATLELDSGVTLELDFCELLDLSRESEETALDDEDFLSPESDEVIFDDEELFLEEEDLSLDPADSSLDEEELFFESEDFFEDEEAFSSLELDNFSTFSHFLSRQR